MAYFLSNFWVEAITTEKKFKYRINGSGNTIIQYIIGIHYTGILI